jgi:uncharacterized membrane-anchored protein YitT (DUF2179 family)
MIHFVEQYLKNKSLNSSHPFRQAKAIRAFRLKLYHLVKDWCFILTGIFSAAFGLESFLIPNSFIDGGATGISLLISGLSGLPLALTLVAINTPFVFMGFKVISKNFALKTAISIALLALVMTGLNFPTITNEKILVAVFGGFFLGAGIGLAIRGGSVIDGTEVLAIHLSKKFSTTVGDIITLLNILIFSAAAYFLSIETAMYSMITYLSASKTVDFIVEGIEEYMGITVISPHSEEIRTMITDKIGRGVTVYNGKRGYGKKGYSNEIDIVYTVITRLEISKLNSEIQIIDPHAFVVMNSVKGIKGGMVKKRPLSH